MSSLEKFETELPSAHEAPLVHDYVPLIMQVMAAQPLGIRSLALKANIKKSRLGAILHRDPAKRSAMTLPEFQSILRALNLDLMQVIISVEVARDLGELEDERFTALVAVLTSLYRGLPQRLIEGLREIQGMDGSEIRSEWGTVLQSALVKRMVAEVAGVLRRREQILEQGLSML